MCGFVRFRAGCVTPVKWRLRQCDQDSQSITHPSTHMHTHRAPFGVQSTILLGFQYMVDFRVGEQGWGTPHTNLGHMHTHTCTRGTLTCIGGELTLEPASMPLVGLLQLWWTRSTEARARVGPHTCGVPCSEIACTHPAQRVRA